MEEHVSYVRLDGSDLDGLRTPLTRGCDRIVLKDSGDLPEATLRDFLEGIGCQFYRLTRTGEDWQLERTDKDRAPSPGLSNDTLSDQQGPTTQFELRMIDLGLLEVEKGMTVWDVGAGTGSVSVESGRLNPSARFWAIEADRDRVGTIERNIREFGSYNVRPVHGTAPDVFPDLPDPDRVFVGGTRGKIEPILDAVDRRLKEGGLLLANFLRTSHLEATKEFLEQRGYDRRMFQVAVHEYQANGTWQEGPALPVLRARRR